MSNFNFANNTSAHATFAVLRDNVVPLSKSKTTLHDDQRKQKLREPAQPGIAFRTTPETIAAQPDWIGELGRVAT